MKKFFTVCVAFLLLAGIADAFNGRFGASETDNMNLEWLLDSEGTLTVRGSGRMDNFHPDALDHRPWQQVNGQIVRVDIAEGVENVSAYAFYGYGTIREVRIPVSMKEIHPDAFRECANLTDVVYAGTSGQWKALTGDEPDDGWLNPERVTARFEGDDASGAPEQPEADGQPVDAPPPGTDAQPVDAPPPGTDAQPVDAPPPGTDEPPVQDGAQAALQGGQGPDMTYAGYAFANSAEAFHYESFYRIPLERYQAVYGEGTLARTLYENDFQGWTGSAYGMAASAALLLQPGNGVSPSDFRAGAKYASDLGVRDRNETLKLSLTEWIEELQLSAQGPVFSQTASANMNRLPELAQAVRNYEQTGRDPLVICIYPGAADAGQGKALLACYMDAPPESAEARLYVYDPGYPGNIGRSLVLTRNGEGQYAGWRYAVSAQSEWGDASGGSLTFIPCHVVQSVWDARGAASTEFAFLTSTAPDAVIYNDDKEPVAAYSSGVLRSGSACPMLAPDRVPSAAIAVWLKNDLFTVVNGNKDRVSFETRLVNVRQSVSVVTNSPSIKLSVEDETVSGFAEVQGEGFDYEARLLSELDTLLPDVRLKGVTESGYTLTIVRYAGSLNLVGAQNNSVLYVNGEERSVSNYMIPAVVAAARSFADVAAGNYYYEPVKWAISRNITNGTTATTFSPNYTCTRAHILTFLWRANGSPEPSIANPFADVVHTAYYAKAVAWAYEKGLLEGTEFHGDVPCSRAEAMVYLWKLSGSPAAKPVAFQDVDANASYATAVFWGVEANITNGKSKTIFAPMETCTRGHIITFLYRYFHR